MAYQKNTVKRENTINYVPDFVDKTCAGANFKTKKAGRPYLMAIKNYLIKTKTEGTVLGTYIFFGGVPSPKLHEKLEEVGFKVRRRPRTWENKKANTTVDIAEYDRECYSVYYSTTPFLTTEQVELITKLYLLVNKSQESGESFLSASWKKVEEKWGSKEDWLKICAVDNTTTKAAPTVEEVEEEEVTPTGSMLDEIDALI